jgi:hypothetical protein
MKNRATPTHVSSSLEIKAHTVNRISSDISIRRTKLTAPGHMDQEYIFARVVENAAVLCCLAKIIGFSHTSIPS